MSSICDQTALELSSALRRREISAREVVGAFLDRISRLDNDLGAFLLVNADDALAQAETIDNKLANGEPLGSLAGVPVALKDNICVQGQVTTAASRILDGYRPPYDASVVAKLRLADAILLGKTNLDEFAMGSSTETSAFRTTRNPWDRDRTPGGSSGGSAVAVAAGMVPLALGSDTGGSIRLPAAWCGIVGMKPTYGRVSRHGLIAYGSSLDQIGPFARDAKDAALLLGVIAGHDPRDATSGREPVSDYVDAAGKAAAGLRIGIIEEDFNAEIEPQVRQRLEEAIRQFATQGHEIIELSVPTCRYAVATYYLTATAEASSNLARYDGVHFGHRATSFRGFIDMTTRSRTEGFGAEVKRRILLGTFALSAGYKDAYYLKASKVRRLLKDAFDAALDQCDVILRPVAPCPPPRIGEVIDDPLRMYLLDVYTCTANLTGHPAISLPCGFTDTGLPVGFQLTGRLFAEATLLAIAHAYQQWTDWHTRVPIVNQDDEQE